MPTSTIPTDALRLLPSVGTISGIKAEKLAELSYELTFALPKKGKPGDVVQFDLGPLGAEVRSTIRLTRQKVYWIFPSFSIPLPSNVDTQLLLLRLEDNTVAAILPVTTEEYVGSLRGSANSDNIIFRLERDTHSTSSPLLTKLVLILGTQIEEVVSRVVEWLRRIQSNNTQLKKLASEEHIFSAGLTYCTWNSLQPPPEATAKNALESLDCFKTEGIFPRSFLIDDGWQDAENFRLQSFECRAAFLGEHSGLAQVVSEAKSTYGVTQVGAWHTVQGYWCGIEPAHFQDKYQLVKVTKDGYPGPFEPEGFSYYIPHPTSVGAFFDDYYRIMAANGITFTKCDNMASLDNLVKASEVTFVHNGTEVTETLGSNVDIPVLRRAYKEAIQTAAATHFGSSDSGRVIFCMEMSPRVLLGSQIGSARDPKGRFLLRNSDDYYPDQPDSHRYHIFTNVVNAMFTSNLNIIPDLDMFQSHPYIRPHANGEVVIEVQNSDNYPQAPYHAALRSLGAGPVTITDVPGKSDPRIIKKLLGLRTKIGQSVALHASSSPFVSNHIFDPSILEEGTGKALRVFSRAPNNLGAIVGFWNIRSQDGQVDDQLTYEDVKVATATIPGVSTYICYSQKLESVALVDVVANLETDPIQSIRLNAFEFELVTVCPVHHSQGVHLAFLGLLDKYNTLAGLASVKKVKEYTWDVQIKCSGLFAIWSNAPVKLRLHVDGRVVPSKAVQGDHTGFVVRFDLEDLLDGRTSQEAFKATIQID